MLLGALVSPLAIAARQHAAGALANLVRGGTPAHRAVLRVSSSPRCAPVQLSFEPGRPLAKERIVLDRSLVVDWYRQAATARRTCAAAVGCCGRCASIPRLRE